MSVRIGSARGQSLGTSAIGDHATGKEVSIQPYYVHSKQWYVFRAKDAKIREYIAECCEKACANQNIGYSQPQRLYLFNDSKQYGFDPSKVTKNTSCDCSSLVRVCIYYALTKCGYDLDKYAPANFTTDNEESKLMATGLFEKLSDSKHCASSTYLSRGDILNTRVKGHTAILIDSGSKCDATNESSSTQIESTTQTISTTTSIDTNTTSENVYTVTGSTVNIRYGCGTNFSILKSVTKGTTLNKVNTTGWTPVKIINKVYWISNKYIKDNGDTYTVTGSSVNIRYGCGTTYGVYKTIKAGESLIKVDVDGWTPINISNKVYWISSKYIQ